MNVPLKIWEIRSEREPQAVHLRLVVRYKDKNKKEINEQRTRYCH